MGTKAKGVKKAFLTGLVMILVIAALIAAFISVKIYRIYSKDTLTMYGFTDQRDDGTYYAETAGVKSPVLVESDIDLSPYLTNPDAVLHVSGTVTKLRLGHQDIMGIYLPALTFDYRIHTVLAGEEPVNPVIEEQSLAN